MIVVKVRQWQIPLLLVIKINIPFHFQEKREGKDDLNPFQCLAFVCDSRQTARRLTFALAAAFKVVPAFNQIKKHGNLSFILNQSLKHFDTLGKSPK